MGGQDFFARDGIDDDDLEDLSAPANIGGQSEALIVVGGHQGVDCLGSFDQFGSHPFNY